MSRNGQSLFPLNPGQAKMLKATIFDLSELAAKQLLYGVVQVLSLKTSVSIKHFEEILDDATKLTEVKNLNTTQKKQGENI